MSHKFKKVLFNKELIIYLPSQIEKNKIVKLLKKSYLVVTAYGQKYKLYLFMYAIVDIAGQQFKVEKDRRIFVNRLKAEEGASLSFDKVLLIDDDGSIKIGSPYVTGATVTATVLAHLKGDKVIVFKKIRRKGYDKKNGHRQYLTQIKIDEIA